jgi:hypothetical protein
VSLNRSIVEAPGVAARPPLTAWALNRPQRVLLSMVRTVHNLCDEADVQCVMFLATELGMIRPAPFYFSRSGSHGAPAPKSLVLEDALQELIESAVLIWDNGCLRCTADLSSIAPELDLHFRKEAARLEQLSALERKALARATLEGYGTGQDVLALRTGLPFQSVLARAFGDPDGSTLLRRLISREQYQFYSA